MSKYEEMNSAAIIARQSGLENRQRCWEYAAKLVTGLRNYCEMPNDRITFRRWNGKTGDALEYKKMENAEPDVVPSHMVFDPLDGYWRLGINIAFDKCQWASFVLCVADHNGNPMVRIGLYGKVLRPNLDDSKQCNAFYESIVVDVKKCFRGGHKRAAKIGFEIASQADAMPVECAPRTAA